MTDKTEMTKKRQTNDKKNDRQNWNDKKNDKQMTKNMTDKTEMTKKMTKKTTKKWQNKYFDFFNLCLPKFLLMLGFKQKKTGMCTPPTSLETWDLWSLLIWKQEKKGKRRLMYGHEEECKILAAHPFWSFCVFTEPSQTVHYLYWCLPNMTHTYLRILASLCFFHQKEQSPIEYPLVN